jgi:hypothetical protein
MRLGKKKEKERDPESKCQIAEGIHRLVCSCKTAQAPLEGLYLYLTLIIILKINKN